MIEKPFPLRMAETQEIKSLKAVFFDIDDTFSAGYEGPLPIHAVITPDAFSYLWKLYEAGIILVPVTGRPAGWCDHVIRMWPVHAIVGENGAFYLKKQTRGYTKIYLEEESVRLENQKKLFELKNEILKIIPKAKLASDQLYREFDLAIDYCEDVEPWQSSEVDCLLQLCTDKGAMVKLSSIHVNTWYGDYDKVRCTRRLLAKEFPNLKESEIVYLGDSPNDEPFFKEFPTTVGVANVVHFLDRIQHKPKYITEKKAGCGFAEFADMFLKTK